MILTYDAVDAAGRRSSDAIEAGTEREAIELLRSRGLHVTRLEQSTDRQRTSGAATDIDAACKLPLKILVLFTRQMAMLVRAGSGVVPALAAIRKQMTNPIHTEMMSRIITDLEEGQPLNDALRKRPRAFDPVYCAIVAAGEASATLGETFARLSLIVGKRRVIRKKIIGAMAYPILLISMCSMIILALLLFVLPRFADMFAQLGVDTPASTQVLLAVGDFVRNHWPTLLGSTAFIVGTSVAYLMTASGRQWLCDIQLSIPVIGNLRSRLIQAQVFRTIGMLVESSVGLLDSLELARGSTRNRRFQKLFDDVEATVTAGGQPSQAFEASGLVAPYVCQAVRTGEESGNLGEALSYCADVLDEDNEELINVVMRLIEPLILMVMGVVVGGVAISLFLPMFDLTAAIQ